MLESIKIKWYFRKTRYYRKKKITHYKKNSNKFHKAVRIVKNWKVIFPNCEKAFGNKREKCWNIGQPRINRVPSNNESFERVVFRRKLFSNSRESRKRSAEGYGDVSLYKRVLALSQSLATVSANLSRRIVLRPRWWHESSSRLALQCTSHPFQSYVGKGWIFLTLLSSILQRDLRAYVFWHCLPSGFSFFSTR